jgi:hypothetical protein
VREIVPDEVPTAAASAMTACDWPLAAECGTIAQ